MRQIRLAAAAALLCVVVAVLVVAKPAAATRVATSASASASSSSPALFNRTMLAYSSKLAIVQEAKRYRVMVLKSNSGSVVQLLHAANPKLIVLMYTNPLYASPSDSSGEQTCTAYSSDHDRSWFLRNQTGAKIFAKGQGYLMDMGNSAYQKACLGRAISLAKQDGFNGVMLDSLNAQSSYGVPARTKVEKYLTQKSWTSAMQSFLNAAGRRFHSNHLKVMATLNGVSRSVWQKWTTPLDGSEQQSWAVGSEGARQQLPYWTTKLAEVGWSETHRKYAILESYSRTLAGNVYGLASMLLVARGYSSYDTHNTGTPEQSETWNSQYASATALGAARGRYSKLSSGVYERVFKNGVVVVNPTKHSVRGVVLHGTFRSGSKKVSSVSLASASGSILLRASYVSTVSGTGGSNGTGGTDGTGSSGSGSSSGGSAGGSSGTGSSGSGGTTGGSGSTTTAPAALGLSPALFNRTAYKYESTLSDSEEATRYQFVVLTSLDAPKVAALHAANPDLKILMYSMALFSDQTDPNAIDDCTSYATDNANDPSWFLLDQNGNRLPYRKNSYMMDMGNAEYQQACVANTIATAKKDGFDGVMFDGLNSYWKGFVPSSATVAKYPAKSQWQAALQSFLNYAGQTMQADGLLVMANLGGADNTLWANWTAPLSGSQEQGFTDGGAGLAQQAPYFEQKLANEAWSEAHGKFVLEDSYNQTEAGNTFGLGTMLMVANGYSSWSTSNTDDTASQETWYPEYGDAQQLGTPTGAYTILSNGVYERRFQNGVVVVNPSTSSVSSFSLGGTYHGATTSSTSSVSLGATSGLILLKSS